jgi:hypothetical protein
MPERKTKATEKKNGAYISDAQRKRLYAIYKEAGKTDEDVKLYLNTVWKIESTREIPWKAYEDICKWAGDKETTPKADEAEALFNQEDANEDNIQ